MTTRIKLLPTAQFATINRAEHKAVYVAQFGDRMALAVGFTTPGGRNQNGGTGLLYLTGDIFGQMTLFHGDWESDIPNIRAHKLADGWDTVLLHVMTEGPLEGEIGRLGILGNRSNVDVYVRNGDTAGLNPLFIDLNELRLHNSREQFQVGFSLIQIEHPALTTADKIE